MRKVAVLAVALIAAACQDASAPVRGPSELAAPGVSAAVGGAAIPGEYIVVLREAAANSAAIGREIAAAHGGTLGYTYAAALKGFSIRIPDAAAAAIARDPRVAYVEQNHVVSISTDQPNATWGIDRTDQRDRPVDGTYTYFATGAGVTAYIIDTGIRPTHSEFGGRASIGSDQIGDGQNGNDCNGHGTHVAGTVGGTTYGVAKNVTLVAVRVLDCGGSGSDAGVIAGIDWVTANHSGPSVANMSLGGGFSQALNDAVARSTASGVVFAVAAGNGYANACDGSPASAASAITVGATNINDVEADFSDRGPCLDIWAPGVSITSSWIGSDNATNTISGTSMATPHVTGAAALVLETRPGATPADVSDLLRSNATTGKITWNNPFGLKPAAPPAGQDYLLYTRWIGAGPPPPPPAAPSGLLAAPTGWSQIDLAWVDNADNESGTRIERCTGSGCTNFAVVASVGPNVTTYSNTGLSASTTYTYRVRAYNDGGSSDYSNSAEATTLVNPNLPPTARYTWSCSNGRACSFNGTTSSDPENGTLTYSWTFGDGTTGTGATVSHTYRNKATYSVTLTVRDSGTPQQSDGATCSVTAAKSSGSCQ